MDKPFNININKEDAGLNDYLSSWSSFGTRPNKIVIYNTYSYNDFSEIINPLIINSNENKNILREIIPSDEIYMVNDRQYVKIDEDIYISYIAIDVISESPVVSELTFYYLDYNSGIKKIEGIIDLLSVCLIDEVGKSVSKMNVISIGSNGLDLDPIESMDTDSESIEMYYNSDTFKKINKLTKKIKKSKKGLSILYGDRGTGKTSIIEYMSGCANRLMIFIPNNMVELTINNPEFKRFLKKVQNPTIVIDDCETFFNEAYTKSNMFTNNLLQLVDGVLSDSIGLHIITIFNVDDEEEIDHSLIDCNNLMGVIKFDNLDKDESNDLGKHIGHDVKYKTDNRLVDVVKKRKYKGVVEIGL